MSFGFQDALDFVGSLEKSFLIPRQFFNEPKEITSLFNRLVDNISYKCNCTNNVLSFFPVFYALTDTSWRIDKTPIFSSMDKHYFRDLFELQNKLEIKSGCPSISKSFLSLNGTKYDCCIKICCTHGTNRVELEDSGIIAFYISLSSRLNLFINDRDFIQKYANSVLFDDSCISQNIKENEFLCDFCKKLFPAVTQHTVYLQEENDLLYYIFSSSVADYTQDVTFQSRYGLGGVFVVLRGNWEQNSLEREFIEKSRNVINRLSACILIYYHLRLARIRATKSAIGSIMSRNGSHNIGSHVLAALTHHVGTMPDDRVLYQYLQQRMDYIATVTTDFPSWGTSTMFVGDIMKTFLSQRHLLEYISGSEGLHAYRFQEPNLGDMERRNQIGKIKLFIRRLGAKSPEPKWELLETAGKDATHFIRYPDKEGIHFIDYKDDSPLPLEHDVALAIPGGVIGEHAFFTILENIIRNAAKHGWGAHSRKADNLEIYIDFIDDPEKGDIEFTVWDNMSDVFSPLREKDGEIRSWESINNINGLLPQAKKLEDYLTGAELENLKGPCFGEESKKDETKIKIEDLPLHWQSQLRLNQQLITDQGELRRENWGLAEMRISAGYLQGRTVGQIGGLEDLPEGDHIILPVAVPGVCTSPDNENGGIRCPGNGKGCSDSQCPIKNKLYHLGYRFKVPKPREMLIVLNDGNAPANWEEFKKAGVYFAKADSNGKCTFCDNDEEVKNFNFDYVVFPDETTAEKCGKHLLSQRSSGGNEIPEEHWRALFPFRLLYCSNLSFSEPQSLKNEVYKLWLEKLKSEREETRPLAMLTMQLQTEGTDSGSGRGLITDRDLLEFVFRNNFHSVITNLKPEFADYPDCSMILDLLSVYPEPYSELPKEVSDDIYGVIAGILVFMCEKLEHSWPVVISRWETDRMGFAASYRARIKERLENNYLDRSAAEIRAAVSAFAAAGKTFSDDDLLALIQDDSGHEDDASPFGALVDATGLPSLARALHAAYQTADTLLRKYEERIVTLPQGYSASTSDKRKKNEGVPNKRDERDEALGKIGIKLSDGSGFVENISRLVGAGVPMIKYCRHDKSRNEGTIYAEALSGSQSYLNLLHRGLYAPDDSAPGLFVRLAENALIRLLIIDERVSNFLKSHPDTKAAFAAMNIDVVDVTDKKPENAITDKKDDKRIDLKKLLLLKDKVDESEQQAPPWDMLIIHQGVIDKWFPNDHKDKEAVGKLIGNLQNDENIKSGRVVVTTGRGRPDNIPDWVKILPFSMLESTLFRNYPEKLLLVGAVMNALPPSDKNRN